MQRNSAIDFLRGVGIIVMIFTHATSYFLSNPVSLFIWNWSHFAVVQFIFCSAYLFFKSSHKTESISTYLKNRVGRLLVPYYIFLSIYLVIDMFLRPHEVTITFITKSIFLIGGIDIHWLIVLFVSIALELPVISFFEKNSRIALYVFAVLSFISSVALLFIQLPILYTFYMWVPWTVIIYFALVYIRFEKNLRVLRVIALISIMIFVSLYGLQSSLHHSLLLIQNKYPPNLMYLSYGMSFTFISLFFHKISARFMWISNIVHFFSIHSYSIFFVHYLFYSFLSLYIQTFHLTWYEFVAIILVGTVVIQLMLNQLQKGRAVERSFLRSR